MRRRQLLNPASRIETSLKAPVGRTCKRVLDIVAAALLLLLILPAMLAIAMLVRRDGGPALFRHQRIGAGGRSFTCLKFRSMAPDADSMLASHLNSNPEAAAEWKASQKLRHDPRVTKFGRIIRQTSLDELPQLFNVLCGDMSLVGPRPIVHSELMLYGAHAASYLLVRPGLTGLWQVSGRSDTSYERRIALDVSYVRTWSLWQDMAILMKTIPVVLLRSGAV